MASFLDSIGSFLGGILGPSQPKLNVPQNLQYNSPLPPSFNNSPGAGGSAQLTTPGRSSSPSGAVYGPNPAYGPNQPAQSSPVLNNGGGNNNQPSQPSSPSYEDIIRRSLDNALGNLGSTKDSLLDQIGATYGNVRQQAQDTLSKNVAALNQDTTDVNQGYANTKTEQSRLLSDTQLRNRNLARALGDLNSSFYEGAQNKANAATQANVSNLSQNQRSQLDQIAQEIANQNTDYGTKLLGLSNDEASARNNVLNQYQQGVGNANTASQNSLDNIALTLASLQQQGSRLGQVTNPIADATSKVNLLKAINTSGLVPVTSQNQGVYDQAVQAVQNGQDYNSVVGYLKGISPQLASEFQLNVQPKPTGIFGLGTPTYNVTQPQGSSLDAILKQLGLG